MSFHVAATIAALAGVALVPALARAHVVADPDEGPANGYFRTAFRVSHGCKGSPTLSVTIRLPDGVTSAKPMPKPGWTVEIAAREITWRGRLDNAQFDEFALLMKLPDRPGETLWFPTVQTCESGTNQWTGIPAAGQGWRDVPNPAPFVRLRKAGGGHGH